MDACLLLTADDVQRIIGEPLQKTVRTENASAGLRFQRCLFSVPTEINSVALALTLRGTGSDARNPRAFFEEKLEEYEHGGEEGEKEEHERALDFVPGVGDRAVWFGTLAGGHLYVLKGDVLLEVLLGTTTQPAKLRDRAIEIGKVAAGRL
ncbi:MAG: hypothetical protein ABI939_06055 [Anaerolineaceae bacterium]